MSELIRVQNEMTGKAEIAARSVVEERYVASKQQQANEQQQWDIKSTENLIKICNAALHHTLNCYR